MCKNCKRPEVKLVKGRSELCSRCYKVKLYGTSYHRVRPVQQRGTCTICKQERLLVNQRRECRRCRYDQAEQRTPGDWQKKQRRKRQERRRKRLLSKTLGSCAICGKTGQVQLDHKHDLPCGHGVRTKPCNTCRRGYLCHLCNKGLGLFQDSPGLLESAREYLLAWDKHFQS